MYKVIEYAVLLIALWLLQILLMDNLSLGVYVVPLICVAAVILLPTGVNGGTLLLTSFALGTLIDISSGGAGLNTIALVATAFSRPFVIRMTMGHDEMNDSVVPTSSKVGVSKFLRYSIALVIIHSTVYFFFEVLSFNNFYLTGIRIIASSIITVVFVYIIQLLFATFRK